MTTTPHPTLPHHWYVDNVLVAGAATASEAMALLDAHRAAVDKERPATPDDVRLEASQRMQRLVGARDAAHLEIKISNTTREAVRLLRKGAATWSPAEAERAEDLARLDQAIEAIRKASNILEANPPSDYREDTHWPT